VLLPVAVVEEHRSGGRVSDGLCADRALRSAVQGDGGLEHSKGSASVPVGGVGEGAQRILVEGRTRSPETALRVAEGALGDLGQVGGGESLEHEDPGPGEQRGVHLERRVLGGGGEQRKGAVLDVRQQGILLPTVQAMDLVDEHHRTSPLRPVVGGEPCGLADLLDACRDGGQWDEASLLSARQQTRQGGLTAPGRAPQDERRNLPSVTERAQRRTGPQQTLLPQDLSELGGTHAIRERRSGRTARGLLAAIRALLEEVEGASARHGKMLARFSRQGA
jgi:hypothetical protein